MDDVVVASNNVIEINSSGDSRKASYEESERHNRKKQSKRRSRSREKRFLKIFKNNFKGGGIADSKSSFCMDIVE